MIWTPLRLQVLLHHYVSPQVYVPDSDAAGDALSWLKTEGLVRVRPGTEGYLEATPKGRELVERTLERLPSACQPWTQEMLEMMLEAERMGQPDSQRGRPRFWMAQLSQFAKECWTGKTRPWPQCSMCHGIEQGGGFGPRHDGSQNCQSGSIASGGTKAHCTCDICF